MCSVADKALVTTTSNCAMVCRVGLEWTASPPTGYKGTSSERLGMEGDKSNLGNFHDLILQNELIEIFCM